MKIKHFILNFLVISIISCSGIVYRDYIRSSIRDFFKTHNEMAAIYKVAVGETIYTQGIQGYADRENKILFRQDQKMPIASVTKTMTAALVLKMQEKGMLTVHDEVAKYFPDGSEMWGGQKAPLWASHVTIHHLLTHTSGLPEYVFAVKFDPSSDIEQAKKLVFNYACTQPLTSLIRDQYNYSNTNYFILGVILEKITGKDFAQLLKKELTDTVGLYNTYLPTYKESMQFQNNELPEAAKRYNALIDFKEEKVEYSNITPQVYLVAFSDGGVISTVDDLVKWNNYLHSGRFLSQFSYKLMTTAYTEDTSSEIKDVKIGYGLKILELPKGHKLFFHPGSAIGIRAETGYSTFYGMSYAILSNVMQVKSNKYKMRDIKNPELQIGIEFLADEIYNLMKVAIELQRS